MDAALMQWESEFSMQESDPSCTLAPDVSAVISAASSDELSEVDKGIDCYFCCRKPGCMWAGLKSEWAQNNRYYQFADVPEKIDVPP